MGRLSDILEPAIGKALARRKRTRAPADDQPVTEASGTTRWHIKVDAAGWCVSDGSGGQLEQGKVALPLEMRDQAELLKNMEAAFTALKRQGADTSSAISLTVNDPQIEVLDNRLIRGGLGDRESAARLAREVLGRDESAYDVCDFGQRHADDTERKVIAAVPLDRIRDYLLAAGDLAITIRSVAPAAAHLIGGKASPSSCRGLLEVGMRQCQLILADQATGAIVQRVIPFGAADIASRLAEAQSMSVDEAFASLGERDFFSRLSVGQLNETDRSSRSEEAILSVAAPLLRDISQTIEDFAENRLVDAPEQLLLFGVHDEIKGLAGWLERGLKLKLAHEDNSFAEAPEVLNLLRGTSDALIVRGKTRYRFRGDHFEPVKDDAGEARAEAIAASKTDRFGRKKGKGETVKPPANLARNRRALIMAGVAAAGLACMLVWEHLLAPAEAQTLRSAGALTTTVDRSLALQSRLDELIETHAKTLKVRAQASNKILWTEKFLALSDAIPPGLWLTETAIIQDERSVGATDVITTKLRIRGRTVLDERKNLADIATLIQALEADDRFMSDFRKVTFEGMAPAGDGTLKFEVHAWYDQNKRKKANQSVAGEGGSGPIDQLKQRTDARARSQDELLNLNPSSAARR